MATGAKALVQCFVVQVTAKHGIGMKHFSQPEVDSGLSDLRIVDSSLREEAEGTFSLVCGYSDGSIRVRVCLLG
jgi:hypothetical protein